MTPFFQSGRDRLAPPRDALLGPAARIPWVGRQMVDDGGLIRAPEGRLLDAPDGLPIPGLLLADHPRESAGASPAGTSW